MVFSSPFFLFAFLPVALGLYYAVPRRGRHLTLTLLSYAFYGWAHPWFVCLMLGSTLVDYVCGRVIAGGTHRKLALVTSICTNLGLLGFFKYFNFGVDSYNQLCVALGLDALAWDTTLRVVLPLGISFYTFQSMSYTIDVYRGDARPRLNFVDFACYVSMFPQLVAGPIVRFRELDRQLDYRSHTADKFARGAAMFCLGLGKKVLLANPCGEIADIAFDAASLTPLDAWYGAFAYSFQIYFDFSGYSDMAIGLGLMLGFEFPKNFDRPYTSESITEFWRRWHLSLSRWLRDYLYLPLGGNRRGRRRTYVNLAIVMLLGGLWHGASWNFVLWGAIHGGLLASERAAAGTAYGLAPRSLRIGITFVIVTLAWVPFRAATLPEALDYLGSMFGIASPQPSALLVAGLLYRPYDLLVIALCAVITWRCRAAWAVCERVTWPRAALAYSVFGLAVLALTAQRHNPFIYFIF